MAIFLVKGIVWNAMSDLAKGAIVGAGYRPEFIKEKTASELYAEYRRMRR